jgi:hypothetical protein
MRSKTLRAPSASPTDAYADIRLQYVMLCVCVCVCVCVCMCVRLHVILSGEELYMRHPSRRIVCAPPLAKNSMYATPRAPTPAVSPHPCGSAEETYVRRPSNAREKRRPPEVIHIPRHVNDLRLSPKP